MVKLTVIDPEELSATGHHRSVDREIEQACKEVGIKFCLLDRSHFSLRTYLSDEEIQYWLENQDVLDEDYARISIQPGDKILIHTASPWHIAALSRRIRSMPNVSLAVGLIYPLAIWTSNETIIGELSRHLDNLIRKLSKEGVFFYSETGYLDLRERRIELPILVLPLSQKTISHVLRIKANRSPVRKDIVRFGFFGQPRPEKGFNEIMELLATEKYPGKEFRFFLPTDYQAVANTINSLRGGNNLRAVTGKFDHKRYFKSMESCDAVLCFYDPLYYGKQMSGIVTDAPLLGKATVVSRRTEPGNFLKHYGGGSYLPVDFSLDSLHLALSMPNKEWQKLKLKAEASEQLLIEMKSAKRYLQVALDVDLTNCQKAPDFTRF